MRRVWRPENDDPLFILAMDHRESFGASLFGVVGDPDADQSTDMRIAKELIYNSLVEGESSIVDGRAGVLVDEQLGSVVIDRAHEADMVLAVPIEASGHDWFTLEYGEAWLDHVERVQPDYVKVLVRDNPDFDSTRRAAQLRSLAEVASTLRESGFPLLYELIVPAAPGQLLGVGGDALRFDTEIRPSLVAELIDENYAHGIEPELWKVEGLETVEACQDVAEAAAAGERTARLIVLGRDAPAERVDHWLRIASQVESFVGFAIGRTIWEEAVREFEASGRTHADRARAVATISARYARFVAQWHRP
jgi:myo-inositol catabolism protein IolC